MFGAQTADLTSGPFQERVSKAAMALQILLFGGWERLTVGLSPQ